MAAIGERTRHVRRLQQLLRQYPVVTVLDARQVGKTTLAHAVAARVKRPTTFFDLERRADRARLADPDLALAPFRGIVVLDEIHRARPRSFPCSGCWPTGPGWARASWCSAAHRPTCCARPPSRWPDASPTTTCPASRSTRSVSQACSDSGGAGDSRGRS